MKFLPVLFILALFTSCKTVQKTGFEKRRYQPGFYHNSNSSAHSNRKAQKETTIQKKDKQVMLVITDDHVDQIMPVTNKTQSVDLPLASAIALSQKVKTPRNSIDLNKIISKSINKPPINISVKNSIQKSTLLKKTKAKKEAGKKTNLLAEMLLEGLVILIITLIYYLIALGLLLIFPTMLGSTALGLAAVIMLAAIIVLALVLSKSKKE